MNVRLYDGPVETSPALLARLGRRMEQALGHLATRIGEVRVWLTDLNAARGGADKCCRIVAHVPRHGPLVVESREDDYYRAVDAATAKLQRAATRRLRK